MEGSGDVRISGVGGILTDRFLNNQVVTGGGGGQGAAASVAPPIEEAIGQGKGIKIRNAGLEASTADVATEFSNMILTQRGYQANTRIVTVTDSMLEGGSPRWRWPRSRSPRSGRSRRCRSPRPAH